MIVGGYDLHLYCRHEGLPVWYRMNGPCPKGHHVSDEFPHKYSRKNESRCMAAARADGWVFSNGDATCPRCAGK